MKGRMYFDLFGHRDYNMMQPFFMVDPVLKQPLRGSRRPRSYIQCIQDSNRPLSSLLRYFSRNSPILQVFAHHIPDKLAVSFNSSSSLLSSYKWFLTIGSKYSFVKAYNVEI